MAKQLDVSKLFKEKFETFELANSANIELAMKKKLQAAKFWNVFKWISGVVVLTGISLFFILPLQLDDASNQNLLKESPVEFLAEKNEPQIENFEEINQVEEATLIKDGNQLEILEIEDIIEKPVLVKKEVELETQSLDVGVEEAHPIEISHIKTKQPFMMKTREPEYFNINNKDFNYLVPKYSLIIFDDYEAAGIEKVNLELKPKNTIEASKTTKKAKFYLPNKVEPLPYGGTGNKIGYGEINVMPFLFHNLESSALPTSDTVTQSKVKENAQFSYQIGIAFRLQNRNKPWFIQTGLNYQNYREKVDYKFHREYIDHELSFWDYDSIYEYHIDPPNIDTILVGVDSSYMEHWVKTENTKTHINSYTYLNIPFMVGYHFKKGRRPVSFQLSAGIGLSVLLKNTGYLYNEYGQIINYSSVEVKPILNWSILLNTTLNYELKNGHTLFIRPSFQYQLSKTNVVEQPQQRKYFVYGLSFGYRIKIF